MPYKCDRECFNRNDDGWCKDEWCRNPVPSVPYGAVYRHTDYAEEVYDKYTDTAGNLHWTGTHSGKHIFKADGGLTMAEYIEREAVLRRMQKIATEAWKMRIKANVETVWNEAQDVLRFFPAADVRPVVLCRDCVNYVESDEANGEKMCVIDAEWCEEDGCYYGFNSYTEPDWFCAGGKKREES